MPRLFRLALLLVVLLLAVPLSGCTGTPPDDDGEGPPASPGPSPPPAPVVWGSRDDAVLRPGASLGGYCTFNWLFVGNNSTAYVGTAGHCTTSLGERVEVGPGGPQVGSVVYDSDLHAAADPAVDFALIRIDPERQTDAHPAMLGHEGPVGPIGASEAAVGDRVSLYGHGQFLGDNEATRARMGVLTAADGREYEADMPAVPGDSGAPLLHVDSNKALGIISRFNTEAIPPSTDVGPMLPFILNELRKAGFDVQLATL